VTRKTSLDKQFHILATRLAK